MVMQPLHRHSNAPDIEGVITFNFKVCSKLKCCIEQVHIYRLNIYSMYSYITPELNKDTFLMSTVCCMCNPNVWTYIIQIWYACIWLLLKLFQLVLVTKNSGIAAIKKTIIYDFKPKIGSHDYDQIVLNCSL